MNKDLVEKFIKMVSCITDRDDLIQEVVLFLKNNVSSDGVGIRLKEGDDYPYYTTIGFTDHFIKAENFLCKRDECGNVVRDKHGNPILECMCGDILKKKYDSNRPFYTKRGSFRMVEGPNEKLECTVKEMDCMVRGRCMHEGYLSVAIIPIPIGEKNIGLIQLNSKNKFAFSVEEITMVEEIAIILGRALNGIVNLEESRMEKRKSIEKNLKEVILELKKLSSELLLKL